MDSLNKTCSVYLKHILIIVNAIIFTIGFYLVYLATIPGVHHKVILIMFAVPFCMLLCFMLAFAVMFSDCFCFCI